MFRRLRTARLEIVPGTAGVGRAEMGDRARFAALPGADVPASWPPPENDENRMRFSIDDVESHPDGVGWAAWHILLCEKGGCLSGLIAGCVARRHRGSD